VPLIVHSEILRIHAAAVTAGLASNRDALLAGVPHALRTSIPTATSPSAQLLTDLDSLNRVDPVLGEVAPLHTWLLNATALTQERAEVCVFREATDIVTTGLFMQKELDLPSREQSASDPAEIFISSAPDDEKYRLELEAHLAPLVRNKFCRIWHMGMVVAGQEWEAVTSTHLETASMIVLLISSTYLADPQFTAHVRTALRRHDIGDIAVVPIIVRACYWKAAPFSHLMPLPRNGKPIAKLHDRDSAWVEIAKEIEFTLIVHESAKAHARPLAQHATGETSAGTPEFRQAHKLIRDELPGILYKRIGNPYPLLARCDIPGRVARGATTLAKWEGACKWLSSGGIQGIISALMIISEMQIEAFSDEASQWSRRFIQAIVADEDVGRGGLDKLLPVLHRFAEEEAQRWTLLCRKIHNIPLGNSAPHQSAAYSLDRHAYECARIWAEVKRALELHHFAFVKRDEPWPEAPPDIEELVVQPQTRKQQHEAELALGVPRRQLQSLNKTAKTMLSQGRQGRHDQAALDGLTKLIVALRLTLLDVADSGYFDEDELDDYVKDLSKIERSLEHQTNDTNAHSKTTKLLNDISKTVDWIEALLDGRVRNCSNP
jgi:hypothetical protein